MTGLRVMDHKNRCQQCSSSHGLGDPPAVSPDARSGALCLGLGLVPVLCVLPFTLLGADDSEKRQLEFFERSIRPVLIEHCYKCHGGESDKQRKGGLNLSFRNGLLTGGERGPAIVPGKPDQSLMIRAVRYGTDLQMPPAGKLDESTIDNLIQWVAMGAPDPREKPAARDTPQGKPPADSSKLWSLQPITNPQPPKVIGADNPIDRFVRAALAKQNIPPAELADHRVLLRRLHLDLIGLPPKPQEHEAFETAVADDRHTAVETVVDRLLANPGFGDRWARHWLDLTAYADTLSLGRSIPAYEAWRYRDYVIDAFNDDKSLPEFIRQQIAGDMPDSSGKPRPAGGAVTAEDVVATGFLAIGPWELVNGDKTQLQMDVVDRQLTRVGKAFLGMSFDCARCHDHKFDPISQGDYFGLAGIFKSTVTLVGSPTEEMVYSGVHHAPLPESRQRRERLVTAYRQELQRTERDIQQARKELESLDQEIDRLKKNEGKAGGGVSETIRALENTAATLRQRLDQLGELRTELKLIEPHRTRSLALAVADAPEATDCRVNIRGDAHQLGPVVPRGFPRRIAPTVRVAFSTDRSGRLELAKWIADRRNPLTARVWVNRIWQHLLGVGLVGTVDNFGVRGEVPSHPELLDHLATWFMDHGWSTKSLIRYSVLTRTWQQASVNPAALAAGAAESDPDNRLLWRANRWRLEAEAIRDSMLLVSDRLSHVRGGPTLPVEVPGNVEPDSNGPSKMPDDAKFPEALLRRRTVYLPQKRKGPFDAVALIGAFDLPDTDFETGRRSVTAVPTQALYLANAPFVEDCGRALAERVSELPTDSRIDAVYRHVLGRPPRPEELRLARDFVRHTIGGLRSTDSQSQAEAWARFCQAMLMTNEFLFRS
jgi:hypothetical protein